MSEGEEHDVAITCLHGDRTEVAGTLVMRRYASVPAWGWTLSLVLSADGGGTGLTAELIDDRALSEFATPDVATEMDKAGRYRQRYRFECTTCGDTLPAREDKLARCGAELAGHGRSDVPLSTLRRMLALI